MFAENGGIIMVAMDVVIGLGWVFVCFVAYKYAAAGCWLLYNLIRHGDDE